MLVEFVDRLIEYWIFLQKNLSTEFSTIWSHKSARIASVLKHIFLYIISCCCFAYGFLVWCCRHNKKNISIYIENCINKHTSNQPMASAGSEVDKNINKVCLHNDVWLLLLLLLLLFLWLCLAVYNSKVVFNLNNNTKKAIYPESALRGEFISKFPFMELK